MDTVTLKEYRKVNLQITQAQLAAVFGMGVATINRYENGGTPTPAHLELIRGLDDPNAFLRLLEGKEKSLGVAVYNRLLFYAEQDRKQFALRQFINSVSSKSKQDNVTVSTIDAERLKQIVIFFTQQGEWKTKLNKLLFYSDFFNFRYLGKPITGMRYVVGHYGPIPDHHEQLYVALIESGVLKTREEFVRDSGEPVEKLVAIEDFNRNLFTQNELTLIEQVAHFFQKMSAKQVADYSHDEQAYLDNELGALISYSYAESLREILESKSLQPRLSSLAKTARTIAEQVPVSEFKKLPKDGARNMDHYLYGHKKRDK